MFHCRSTRGVHRFTDAAIMTNELHCSRTCIRSHKNETDKNVHRSVRHSLRARDVTIKMQISLSRSLDLNVIKNNFSACKLTTVSCASTLTELVIAAQPVQQFLTGFLCQRREIMR